MLIAPKAPLRISVQLDAAIRLRAGRVDGD